MTNNFFFSSFNGSQESSQIHDAGTNESRMVFAQELNLTNRIKKQRGSVSFECKECKMFFATKNIMKIHVRKSHTENELSTNNSTVIATRQQSFIYGNDHKNYICQICRTLFSHSSNLLRHKKNLKNLDNHEPLKCNVCTMLFCNQKSFNCHIKKHSG